MKDIIKHKIDESTIYNATAVNSRRIKRMKIMLDTFKEDPDKDRRIADCLCKYCYYIADLIGGSTPVKVECGICGKLMEFKNIVINVICEDCAKKYELCKRCGGDIEMRLKAKKSL